MENFNYYNPTRIVFGNNTEKEVGKFVKRYHGTRVLLHYGRNSIKENGLYTVVLEALQNESIEVVELSGVVSNPRWSLVEKGINIVKEKDIDFILAVGGGSVIDSAKAIAAGAKYEGNLWDVYEHRGSISQALPIGVVLTIPAAGSESSIGSVITKEEGLLKRDILSEHLIPKFAIVNPKYHLTLPKYQTACGIADMFSHLMERYFTNVEHVDFTDRLLEGAMKSVLHLGPQLINDLHNLDLRNEISWISTVAHNGLLGTGRIGDWASHKIEHELSGMYDIAHGAGLTIVIPAWMKYVYRDNPARFEQFSRRVWNVDYSFDQQEFAILEGIQCYENFSKSLGLPTRLSDVNIGDESFKEMADKCCTNQQLIGELKKLNRDDIYNILMLAK